MADGWQTNHGTCPGHLRGTEKRVNVILRNGLKPPESWPAHGRGACNWQFGPKGAPSAAFEITHWKEAK